jgi:glycosyltransferase involved in cell wall biosynthesis
VPWIFSERSSEAAYPPSTRHWLRQHFARRADAVVSNSAAGDRYWRVRLGSGSRRYVIPNALPLEEIQATAAADAHHTGIRSSDALILFAGRLVEHKDPETFVRALVQVLKRPNTAAVVAGDGPLGDSIRSIAQRHGIHDRIQFAGYLHDVWSWMKRADVFVSPSRVEGHPNTVLEAAACGCPLIVSDIPAHREFLDDASALFVPTEDATALARAINDVLDGADASRTRAERAARVVAKLSPPRIAQEYERVYLEVIERAAGGPRQPCAES